MSEYIKPPAFSTNFSESSKRAKKRFENILNTKAKKTGTLAFILISCIILVVGTMIACSNQRSDHGITNIGGSDKPDSLFAVSTGNIHDYMPKLLAEEAVSDYELLPCLENFNHSIWSEFNTTYGRNQDWWNRLLIAINDAAVSKIQDHGIDQSLRNYYIGKAYLASDGAYAEGLSDIVVRQWEYDRTLYSAVLAEHFSKEEENILRRNLTYLIGYENNFYSLFIPDCGRSLYLDAYPVDFPFGFDITEKDRKTYRAESFGQVTVVESAGLQVTYLTPTEGVYTVITIRADKKNYTAAGISIGDKEESLLEQLSDKLKKLDKISYDDEAWFSKYDLAYAYTPQESTKSMLFLVRDGMVSGIELINGLDGNMY